MESTIGQKEFSKQVTQTIIGSIISSLGVALVTGFSFYYDTNAAISIHGEKLIQQSLMIKEHSDAINKMNSNLGMTDAQAIYFEKRLNNIEEAQKEILREIRESKK